MSGSDHHEGGFYPQFVSHQIYNPPRNLVHPFVSAGYDFGNVPPNIMPNHIHFSTPVAIGPSPHQTFSASPQTFSSSPQTFSPDNGPDDSSPEQEFTKNSDGSQNKRIKTSRNNMIQNQKRGSYKCSRCGNPKKGHHCNNEPQSQATEVETLKVRVYHLEEEKKENDKKFRDQQNVIHNLSAENTQLQGRLQELDKVWSMLERTFGIPRHNIQQQIYASPVASFPTQMTRTSSTSVPEL